MRAAIETLRFLCVAPAIWLAACAAPSDSAATSFPGEQQQERESPTEAPLREGDGSLAALTAEVRQLRVAVEDLAQSQSEAQALGVYLSAQQSRLKLADEQLAAVREQIESSAGVREELEARLAELLLEQSRAPSPQRRAEIEARINDFRSEQGRVDRQLQQARDRENDLSRALQAEESRFNDLIARLEELAQ